MLPVVAAGLLIGLLVTAFRAGSGPVLALAPLAGGALLFVMGGRVRTTPRRWVIVASGLLGAIAGSSLAPSPPPSIAEGVATVCGTVDASDASGLVVLVDAITDDAGAHSVERTARALVRGVSAEVGVTLCIEVELRPRAPFRNPSPHPDWPASTPLVWIGRGRAATMHVMRAPGLLRRASTAIRSHVHRALERTLAEPTEGIVLALVLGDERDVDETAADQVRGAGLTHVLAVSGMHVTIVVGLLLFVLLRVLRVRWIAARVDPVRLAHGLAAPLALAYAELAGGSPSAYRAAVTACIAWGLRAAGRRPDPLATTALAILVFAPLDPQAAMRPAFLLSIAATVAILELPGEATLEALVRGSLRATLATAPLVWWCFDGVPLVGILANVVMLPVVAAILLPLATIHALLASIAPALSDVTGAPLDLVTRGFVGACEAFSRLAIGRTLPPGDVLEGVLVSALAMTWLSRWSLRARVLATAVLIALLGAAEARLRYVEQPIGELRITFLDVGQGDSALVDLPDGSLIVVDAGGAVFGGRDPGEHALVPILRARRRDVIDTLVVTHPHPDHYGGVAATAARLAIREVWDSGQAGEEDPDGAWATWLATLGPDVPIRGPGSLCGHPITRGGASIEVLWPCPAFDTGWDPNDNSLVLRIRFGDRTFLLLGDAEAHEESELVRLGLVGPVDVLKVGHHGSRTSSTDALLAATRPRLAVVSAGVGNRFGHPHAEVIARLTERGARVLRTDRDGGVIVRTDGRSLEVETWSGLHEALDEASDAPAIEREDLAEP
jgi:competence protein ComEC